MLPQCPETEILASLLSNGMLPGDRDSIQAHIAACQGCSAIIARMKAFDEPQEAVSDWPRVEQRLRARFEATMKSPSLSEPARAFHTVPARRSFAWHPAIAWLVAASLVYPAFLGIVSHRSAPQASPPPDSLEETRIVDLTVTRDGHQATGLAPIGQGHPVAFRFVVPVREGFRYEAGLLDLSGRLVAGPAEAHGDAYGNFAVLFRGVVAPGSAAELQVTELDPDGAKVNSWAFPIPL
jgi:hypothetical protein